LVFVVHALNFNGEDDFLDLARNAVKSTFIGFFWRKKDLLDELLGSERRETVRSLKWHASWVQNVVRQFGL
jgi:hypothetical protein